MNNSKPMPTTTIYELSHVKAYITYTIGWLPEMGHSVYRFALRFDSPTAKPIYLVHTVNASEVINWFRSITERYNNILAKDEQNKINAKKEVQLKLL